MSFLRLHHLGKQYGKNWVVQDFSLDVAQGEFVSLLGPSGCGKTTTLQMIAGFVQASAGTIELQGRDITRLKPHLRGLGVVFQSYALFPHMTVRQNVEFGLEMRKCPAQERRERAMRALELVHLQPLAERYPRELSGGQRQRVALARALVIEPPLLLLDEPLSNLDAQLREEMQFELRDIQRKLGTTTIMVTHDQAEAMSISDRVVVMQAGRITQMDTPQALYEHPRTPFISHFVGKANVVQAQPVLDAQGRWHAVAAGIALLGPLDGPPAGQRAPSARADSGALTLAIRPEKLLLTTTDAGRCRGHVTQCLFLGSQWLYALHTPLGTLMALRTNDGTAPLALGQEVGIDWQAQSLRLLETQA
ncbi:ABC transporter ATP-binding protein [Vandammella animalimorsus]|uniref:Fe3+/spermidine/putrescine ABC transporter ATP-binding protein n=1 Tax=Vandammella animalimorsus TaxID=2029117 RepID=A0A2A2A8X4_9BURK|nr:ABC transporter ATP-binding protein [Vandammella animalimorsus]PAT34222.1 Fe3+/spermidine/putrescine ABC transporter ATP-binding protein [Vandammella animalimorsus]